MPSATTYLERLRNQAGRIEDATRMPTILHSGISTGRRPSCLRMLDIGIRSRWMGCHKILHFDRTSHLGSVHSREVTGAKLIKNLFPVRYRHAIINVHMDALSSFRRSSSSRCWLALFRCNPRSIPRSIVGQSRPTPVRARKDIPV